MFDFDRFSQPYHPLSFHTRFTKSSGEMHCIDLFLLILAGPTSL